MRIPRPSPAMVVAGVALVLASSGTTLAASRYLVTSTSQIKPSVLRSLASSARGEVNEATGTWQLARPGIPLVWARAVCPAGTQVISGGYEGDLAPGVAVRTNLRFGNGWTVVATSQGSSSDLGETKLRAHALCLTGTP